MEFSEFGLHQQVIDGLEAMRFTKATPVQEMAIPVVMEGRDLIACAQTGTGKTAAYLLPILSYIASTESVASVSALVIVPTRELALQIDQQLQGFSYFLGVTSIAIYGGSGAMSFEQEKKALTQGADIIICTPGRLIAHLNMGYAQLQGLEFLVLDEADRMLDMGFFEDLMKIVSFLPAKRQNLLFSATMPPKIRDLAKKILEDPAEISISISKPAKGVVQAAFLVYDHQKVSLIQHLLKDGDVNSAIVFTSTKLKASEVTKALQRNGLKAAGVHSDLEQKEREETLNSFRNKQLNVLVATDVLSRGIDIKGIEMVINYDVPHDAEDYVHRVGRTARADETGEAITFINEHEGRKFHKIEELIGQEVRKVPISIFGFTPGPEYDINSSSGERRGGGGFKGKGGKSGGGFKGKGGGRPKGGGKRNGAV